MRKILLVAKRDFLATVSTKGFIITIMVPPLIWGAIILPSPVAWRSSIRQGR